MQITSIILQIIYMEILRWEATRTVFGWVSLLLTIIHNFLYSKKKFISFLKGARGSVVG
jgi:hypothetical protein